jgi:D-proline reductase (dithiol) PrdB
MTELTEVPAVDTDADTKRKVETVEPFLYESPAFTTPPPLANARVAIVTTAGLSHAGDDEFAGLGDQSFRVLPAGDPDLKLSHMSPNWDRAGLAADLNLVVPHDRLVELAAEGTIGSVAPRHFSFMGAQGDATMATIRLDTGPAVAKALLEDGVDVVLLTPV